MTTQLQTGEDLTACKASEMQNLQIGLAARASGKNKKWHQQHEKLVEFQRNNGHCVAPLRCKEEKALGQWDDAQRTFHEKHKLGQD